MRRVAASHTLIIEPGSSEQPKDVRLTDLDMLQGFGLVDRTLKLTDQRATQSVIPSILSLACNFKLVMQHVPRVQMFTQVAGLETDRRP